MCVWVCGWVGGLQLVNAFLGKSGAPARRHRQKKLGSKAAQLLKRTPTQVARHVSGTSPSRKLAADMTRLGIEVAI